MCLISVLLIGVAGLLLLSEVVLWLRTGDWEFLSLAFFGVDTGWVGLDGLPVWLFLLVVGVLMGVVVDLIENPL